MLLVYMAIGALGGIGGSIALSLELRHWIAWLVSLLILEPIGLCCLVAFVFFVSGGRLFGGLLDRVAARGGCAAGVVGFALIWFVASVILYALIQLWHLRG